MCPNVSQSVSICLTGRIEPGQGRKTQPDAEFIFRFRTEQFRRSGNVIFFQEAVKSGFGEAELVDELAFCFELRLFHGWSVVKSGISEVVYKYTISPQFAKDRDEE